MTAMLSKSDLRIEAIARRGELARAVPDFAERIARFAGELALPGGAIVSAYWPMGDEADPRLLMAALAARGRTLALPRLAAKATPLKFGRWQAGDALVAHSFGMQEPSKTAEEMTPQVLLVPLLAFDAEGYRLGYGGGFYDRTLAALNAKAKPVAVGVAYAGQEVRELPHGTYDYPLDRIVTESGVRGFR